jgi:hypothetical protein
MIQNENQLQQTREAAASLERSLAILQRDRPNIHPDRYALMATPILEDLRQLRQSIDDYLGVTAAIHCTVQQEMVRAEGILREIDLDEGSFILRNPDTAEEFRCSIPPEARDLIEIAKAGLDHHVSVAGTRRHDPTRRQVFPLLVREIDVLDAAEECSTE